MAWTQLPSASPNEALPSTWWNYLVANLAETAPGKATTSGRLIVTRGVNTVAEGAVEMASVATAETTGSTSYADLATVGPLVTVTTGTKALCLWKALVSNNTAGAEMLAAVDVSGTGGGAAADTGCSLVTGSAAGDRYTTAGMFLFTGLTPGSHTFKLQYRVNTGGSTWLYRQLTVIAL